MKRRHFVGRECRKPGGGGGTDLYIYEPHVTAYLSRHVMSRHASSSQFVISDCLLSRNALVSCSSFKIYLDYNRRQSGVEDEVE